MADFLSASGSVAVGFGLAVSNFFLSLLTAKLASTKKASAAMGITIVSMIVRLTVLAVIFMGLLKLGYSFLILTSFVLVFTVLTWIEAFMLSRERG